MRTRLKQQFAIKVLPETKSPNIRTEAHGSELDLKFGWKTIPIPMYYRGIPGIPGIYTNQQQ